MIEIAEKLSKDIENQKDIYWKNFLEAIYNIK